MPNRTGADVNGFRHVAAIAAVFLMIASVARSETEEVERVIFKTTFDVKIVPSEKSAEVVIRLGSDAAPVEWMLFRADPTRHQGFKADGALKQIGDDWEWRPPRGGGALRFTFSIDHRRNEGNYDSRCAKRWAIFRGDDLIPQVRIRTHPIAYSESYLRLQLPEGWSAALPYAKTANGTYRVTDPRSRFDRPAGWFVIGKLGAARETVEGARLTIAGPVGHGARRMDLLALLRWTLPSMRQLFGDLPKRLLIVTASDPMWRGGLSGTNSLFIHADRPLIQEDSTSPLLHELMHTLMRARAGSDGDWIVEGLAEHYSLEALLRSGTLSARRHEAALERIARKARGSGPLRVSSVDAATRARAVLVLREIDAEIRKMTGGERGLDDVTRLLSESDRAIVTSQFREVCEEVAGASMAAIFNRVAPPVAPKSRSPKGNARHP